MKSKLITIGLISSLVIISINMYYRFDDTTMRMKHWFLLSLFTANLQILIEKYFRE